MCVFVCATERERRRQLSEGWGCQHLFALKTAWNPVPKPTAFVLESWHIPAAKMPAWQRATWGARAAREAALRMHSDAGSNPLRPSGTSWRLPPRAPSSRETRGSRCPACPTPISLGWFCPRFAHKACSSGPGSLSPRIGDAQQLSVTRDKRTIHSPETAISQQRSTSDSLKTKLNKSTRHHRSCHSLSGCKAQALTSLLHPFLIASSQLPCTGQVVLHYF